MKALIILSAFFMLQASAETVVSVVTKEVRKSLDCSGGDLIRIDAEKARISVGVWSQKKVQIRLKLISKHEDKATAEKNLSMIDHYITSSSGELSLGNIIRIPSGLKSFTGVLKAEYELLVPEECALLISNHFGDVTITGVKGALKIESQYGDINLSGVSGYISLFSDIGDIRAESVSGKTSIVSSNCIINLKNMSGSLNLRTKYGSARLEGKDFTEMNIDADKTEVELRLSDCQKYERLPDDIQSEHRRVQGGDPDKKPKASHYNDHE
jgi:hypothetical protein